MSFADDGFSFFQKAAAAFDTPAFMRRAREMEFVWEHLLERLQMEYGKYLEMPRLRLATLFALLKPSSRIDPEICPDDLFVKLVALNQNWAASLRVPVAPATSERQKQNALNDVYQSFHRFNRRWNEFVNKQDLSRINRLRENYNKYYVFEIDCAFWSTPVAEQGFVPVLPVSTDDLFSQYPLLPVPVTFCPG